MTNLLIVGMEIPEGANIIIGQAHFIKTVEDIYEAVVTTAPHAKFGLAFNESSGACLIRSEGNDQTLCETAIRNAQTLAAGHVFVLMIQNAYPINLLNALRNIPEVCSIFCATANPVEVVLAKSEQGQGVLGVIDGSSPKGVEGEADIVWRHNLLREFGYKR
ncbi:MAG TPA: adenosine-specific kinase [Terracidiphilus sp.]|nr:adenosine-specific kinase [Terracidiphilus sp.]